MENSNTANNNPEPAELGVRLTMLEQKIDQLLRTMNIIKQVIIWVTVASALLFILPLIGLLLALPSFISNYSVLLQS